MSYIENRYFDLNRILLITIGLWPYQQSNIVRFQLALLFGILISFIGFQLSRFLIVECSFDFVIKILSSTFFYIIFAIKYNSFWINKRTVKYLLEQLQTIYKELRDENEIAILENYGKNSGRYTIRMIIITICGLFSLVCMTCSPYIIDMIISKNGTQADRITEIIRKYYIIDQEKYIYLIILHMNVASCIGAIALIATGTMLITYLKQACGILKIASYRIKGAMAINILQTISLKNEILIYKEIIRAVDIHRKAMEFATYLISHFEGSFFILIIFGVCCLSLNLFRIFQMISHKDEINETIILHLIVVTGILLYMFLANYAGQEITDHNNHVFFTIYNVRWYLTSVHVQKLILFLIQRSSKVFSLNIGGLFAASLECFASLASASVSYFTVMLSL